MVQMTGEFPRVIARPVWLTARARNAVHRPIFIGAVGASAFIAALVALVLAPQQTRRVAPMHATGARPDTAAFTAALAQARTRMSAAEASLAYSRAHPRRRQELGIDTLSRALIARRDTLSTALGELDALLSRVEGAPVAASYRALGESQQLAANPRAKALLDSLADVERDREAFGTSGGSDPVYVALSSRSTEIGRAIQAVAHERRDELRQQIAKLIAPAPRQLVEQSPLADTVAWIAERDSARSMVVQASTALTAARTKAQRVRSRDDAREPDGTARRIASRASRRGSGVWRRTRLWVGVFRPRCVIHE